jgi:gliding motility-associated lipoprotein GldB
MRISILYFFILIVLFSCQKNEKVISDAENTLINLKINRLDEQLFNLKDKNAAREFLQTNPVYVKEYLELPYPVKDSQFVEVLYNFYSNPELRAFYQEAKATFGDFSDLRPQFESLFKYTKYYYPKFKVPEIETTVTGYKFNKDLVVSNDAVIISYDYFLGPKSKFKPPLYDYFLDRYQKPYLTSMVALALSSKFNNSDLKDETMLAAMIYYGKAHYFAERVLPELHDSLNIMYSGKELAQVDNHIDKIWGHFIEKELLFNKTRFIVEKYVGERPNVLEIADKCPGRIGRWLGWQIVRKYMKEHPEVSLPQLMEEKDAMKIFKLSNYKPK